MNARRLIPPRYVNVGVDAVFDSELADGPARTLSRLCALAWESQDEDKHTPPLTIEELAVLCGLKRSTIWGHLSALRKRGYIAWQTLRGRLVVHIAQRPVQNSGPVQNFGLSSVNAVAAADLPREDPAAATASSLVQNSGLVQNFGLAPGAGAVQNSGLAPDTGAVQKSGLVQNSGLEANLAALEEYGVERCPYALEVAALGHVTPALVCAWGEHLQGRPGVRNLPGLLLHVLSSNAQPPQEERRGGPRSCKPAAVELPAELLEELAALGFRGSRSLQEVAAFFEEDPQRVQEWVDYVTDKQHDVRNPAGFLLDMLRSGQAPPPPPPDPGQRYISGKYADLIMY